MTNTEIEILSDLLQAWAKLKDIECPAVMLAGQAKKSAAKLAKLGLVKLVRREGFSGMYAIAPRDLEKFTAYGFIEVKQD